MTEDLEVRVLADDELRAANTLFRGSLHYEAASDEIWAKRSEASERNGRTLGAFLGDLLVGTAYSSASRLAVPGGAMLPMAMVTAVGVRADHTRRGVLTAMMRAQLTGIPEPIATLRASEAGIYSRFGYGVATRGRTVVVDRRRAASHPDAAPIGAVRVLRYAEASSLLPSLYDRIGAGRPGWLARPAEWWRLTGVMMTELKANGIVVVHSGPDGDDGFALYYVERDNGGGRTMTVEDMHAAGPEAWAGLWRYLLSVDLVGEVRSELRPLDEPLELLFTDRRVVRTSAVDDETWLRLVDVPAALDARTFGEATSDAGTTVIEVRDDLLPANSGRYLIGGGKARPATEPAELVMDVGALAMLYLGDVAPSALAATGRLTAVKADALRVADRLFAVPESPWGGTFF